MGILGDKAIWFTAPQGLAFAVFGDLPGGTNELHAHSLLPPLDFQ